jgi:hypothetical protein
MLERERDETHTFRKVNMCKWMMYDLEAQVKSSLSDSTWLEDLSMDLSSRHLRTYEANRGASLLFFYFYFISFPFFSLSLFSLFFFFFFFYYFSFLLIIFFFSFFIFFF